MDSYIPLPKENQMGPWIMMVGIFGIVPFLFQVVCFQGFWSASTGDIGEICRDVVPPKMMAYSLEN